MAVRETANASKERFGKTDLAELFDGATKVVVAKGKKVSRIDPRTASRDELAAVVLGPTGNLRAPAIRKGKTWLVGFNEELYAEHFA